jgi:predicted ArsR family transcriptional regulator
VDGWWDEIEREIQECVERHGSLTTSELARHLRMSESAAASVLRVLAPHGNVQVNVRLARAERSQASAAPRTAA